MSFGAEIKRLREAAGLSVRELAELLCVKAERLHKWGERDFNPRSEDASEIERCTGIEISKFGSLQQLPVEEMRKARRRESVKMKAKRLTGLIEGRDEDSFLSLLLELYEAEREHNIKLNGIIKRFLNAGGRGICGGEEGKDNVKEEPLTEAK